MAKPSGQTPRRLRGFERASGLVSKQIRSVGESRGFAVSKVLTHWNEIAGPDIATIARPINVSYARGGFGATLTLLTTGAQAPMLEMQKEVLRDRVNACYGYAAIKRIRITQTAPSGFEDGKVAFEHKARPEKTNDPAAQKEAARTTAPVQDDGLRRALAALGENVLSKNKPKKG